MQKSIRSESGACYFSGMLWIWVENEVQNNIAKPSYVFPTIECVFGKVLMYNKFHFLHQKVKRPTRNKRGKKYTPSHSTINKIMNRFHKDHLITGYSESSLVNMIKHVCDFLEVGEDILKNYQYFRTNNYVFRISFYFFRNFTSIRFNGHLLSSISSYFSRSLLRSNSVISAHQMTIFSTCSTWWYLCLPTHCLIVLKYSIINIVHSYGYAYRKLFMSVISKITLYDFQIKTKIKIKILSNKMFTKFSITLEHSTVHQYKGISRFLEKN